MNKKKFLVGITGGIGSGKSIVCDYLEKKGFVVLKADNIAKIILANDPKVQKKVKEKFGSDSYINGKPNTTYLAETVFSNEKNIKVINSIIHPPTLLQIEKTATNYFEKNSLIFVESALIYEANFSEMFSYVVLVYSDEAERISRVVERDKTSVDSVRQRMQFQIPDEKKKNKADFVIDNSSTVEVLKTTIDFIVSVLESLLKH